jgi:hypothetical protein
MNDLQQTGLATRTQLEPIASASVDHAVVAADDLAIAKLVSDEDRIA